MKTPQELLAECKYMEAYEGDPTPEYDTAKLLAAIEARDAEHAGAKADLEWQRDQFEKAAKEWMASHDALKTKHEPTTLVPSAPASQAVPSEVIEVLKFYAHTSKVSLESGNAEPTIDGEPLTERARECLRRLGVGT